MSNPNLQAEPRRYPRISYKEYYRKINDAIRQEDLNILEPLVMEAPTEEVDLIIPEPLVMKSPKVQEDDSKKPTPDARREEATKKPTSKACRVNLSGDPLISVLIRCHKTKLALELVKKMRVDVLFGDNFEGDTALHVAAAEGDKTVAEAMLERAAKEHGRAKELVEVRNKKNEISLHKAVLYGKREIFWMLARDYDINMDVRGDEGHNVLHYAIMCGCEILTTKVLVCCHLCHLMGVAMEELSNTELGKGGALLGGAGDETARDGRAAAIDPRETPFLHQGRVIPLEETMPAPHESDEEASERPLLHLVVEGQQSVLTAPRKIPSNYATFIDLLKLTYIPVKWVRLLVFNILKQLFSRVESLEARKRAHKQAMKLISYLATYEGYWDFIEMGKKPARREVSQQSGSNPKEDEKKGQGKTDSLSVDAPPSTPPNQHDTASPNQKGKGTAKNGDSEDSGGSRWNDSPLTLGSKMGLHEFVNQILNECPESANYTNPEGQNVLQVAIQNGHEKIVDIVESLTCNGNPVLPSWLLSKREDNTNNTILHFAAETTVKGGASVLQMQYELQWFERVKKLLPRDLLNSRNKEEMTAQELFTKKHEQMVLDSRSQLKEIATACSSLLAAVVFATSFSIPENCNQEELGKMTACKIFPHAYEIGLSCATTALVLFISLLTAHYKEQEFRRSLPAMYFFALTSFFMALLALLVAFFCNIYLSVYGGKGRLVILAGELIAVPLICFLVLLCRGYTFQSSSLQRIWR
ncbi:putative Ankyrin repeat-containing protein [Cocos nucifera]|uniref:Putative Ankyrin repeat-containing protein n=1 Tax=Cocos nucifera TaxID=13894 RepID=A0A8K0ILW9_COCNU|nr:putative Ankyrin repeat-containing protein [Cocos nucifera]